MNFTNPVYRTTFAVDNEVTTPAIGLPIDLALISAQLPALPPEVMPLLQLLTQGVTDQIERYTGRDLLTKVRTARWWNPAMTIALTPSPVQSITSVVSVDSEGNTQTLLSGEDYYVDHGKDVWRIRFSSFYYGIRVVFTTGYGSAADVPAALKVAIMQEVNRQFKNRQDPVIQSNLVEMGLSRETLAMLYNYQVRLPI